MSTAPDRRLRSRSVEGSPEWQAQAKLQELYVAAQMDVGLRADLLRFWAERQEHGQKNREPHSPTAPPTHRNAITAARRSATPCLCGNPIERGDLIVKRWGQWIHDACYDALQAAKAAAR